MLMDSKDSA